MQGDDGSVVFSRSISGGFAGRVRSSCELLASGDCSILDAGTERSGHLSPDQVGLVEAICAASGFADLPVRLDGPRSRTDGYTSTYSVAGHQVSMYDVDRAGDAVPAALRVIDVLVDAMATLGNDLGNELETDPENKSKTDSDTDERSTDEPVTDDGWTELSDVTDLSELTEVEDATGVDESATARMDEGDDE